MASILILEPHSEGHHMYYACWASREAVRLGFEVWLAVSPSAFKHPAYMDLVNEFGGGLRTIVMDEDPGKPPTYGALATATLQFRYHRRFARLYRELEEKPDYVFVPYIDYCYRASAVMGSPFESTPWGGLALSQTFHLSKMGVNAPASRLRPINEWLFYRLLSSSSLRMILALDESLVEYATEMHPELAGKLSFVPEPARLEGSASRKEARERLNIPQGAKVILVYGVLDHSKGIEDLLQSTTSDSFPEEVHILLAGRQSDEVRRLTFGRRTKKLRSDGRLHTRDEHLHGEGEYEVFRASDAVWVGYRGQFVSSGVLLQAALEGLPVISCEEGIIGALTRSQEMGVVVNVSDPDAVAEAVRRMTREMDLYYQCARNSRLYGQDHSVEAFTRAVSTGMKQAFLEVVSSA